MLSQLNYNQLWTVNLGQSLQNIPCYYQYLQREVYFQDYLDLFGYPNDGNPTFERLIIEGKQTVFIQGLCEDPNSEFTMKDQNGEIRLIVNYDFPFDKAELCKGREIKYILIGEAAPPSGSYIYKDAKGSYITAALSAVDLNTNNLNRTKRFIEFANNGFLLIDFYPFAINFDKLPIVPNNETLGFFMNLMSTKINALSELNPDWDFCFIGPKRTSLMILNWLDLFNENSFNGKNTLHPLDLTGEVDFKDKSGKTHADHTYNTNNLVWLISHLSKRAKFTVAVGGSGPNPQLIKRVFYLP